MKNKCFAYVFAVLLFCGLIQITNAQQGSIGFKDGITVAIKIKQNGETQNFSNIYNSSATDKNVIHRVMIDRKNQTYFGYDLEVVATADTKQFEVLIKPLSVENMIDSIKIVGNSDNLSPRSIPKYPGKILVQEGDTIVLDILENSKTKEKISDLIKVTRRKTKPESYFFDNSNPKDFTVNEVKLSMLGFDIYVNDEKVKFNGGGMVGSVIWIYFPNKGRFIFSPIEQPGYNFQRIGVIDNKTMSFNYAGVNYKFISNEPILDSFGKWNLWVMFDPDYQSNSQTSDDKSLQLGATGKVEDLFENQR